MPAAAQSPWTKPVILYETGGVVSQPQAVADQQGDVHLLFVYHESKGTDMASPSALMYMRLHEGRWSEPVDVLVSPDSPWVNLPAITIDPNGMLHAIWQSGSSHTYYSRAYVSFAGSSRGWSQPQVIAVETGLGADIEASADGLLHLVHAGRSGDIYYYQSSNAGDSWTEPVRVSSSSASNSAAFLPRIAASTTGQLHVVWSQNQLSDGTSSSGVFYATSRDNGVTWSVPLQVDGANHGYIDVAAQGSTEVHLSWNASVAIGDRLHQWSSDGGATWRQAELISGKIRGGLTGYSVMAFDSLDRLHLVTSVSGQTGKTEDVYHLMWDNDRWTDPQLLSLGTVGSKSVEYPAIVISSGNQAHAFYEDDYERIWYTNQVLDAPALKPVPLPLLSQATPSPAATPIRSLTATPIATPRLSLQGVEDRSQGETGATLLIAFLPALAFVVGTVVWQLARRRNR